MMPVSLLHGLDRNSVKEFILKGVCVVSSVYMCSDNG